jgi:hypothetical protein
MLVDARLANSVKIVFRATAWAVSVASRPFRSLAFTAATFSWRTSTASVTMIATGIYDDTERAKLMEIAKDYEQLAGAK